MKVYTIRLNNASGSVESVKVTRSGASQAAEKIKIPHGAKVQLVDDDTQLAPDNVRVERVGNDLVVSFPGTDMAEPDLILQDFYVSDGSASLVGQAENGFIYEYVPESGVGSEYIGDISASVVSGQVLGGGSVSAFFAALPPAAGGLGALGIAALTAAVGAGIIALATSSNHGSAAAPRTPSPALDTGSDSGSKGDAITNDNTPTISGSGATPGSRITVTLPTGEVLTTTAALDGSFSVTPTRPLADGLNTVTITETNSAGVSSPAVSLPITIDTVAPVASAAPDLITANDSGNSGTDNVTNVTRPAFAVTAPAAGQTSSLYVDGVKVAATFDPATNTLTPVTALTSGPHTITTTRTDVAGNESAQSPGLSVLIDAVAPGAFATAVIEGPAINAAEAASDGGVPVGITLPTGAAAGDRITVSIDGSAPVQYVVTAANVAAGTATVLIPTADVTAAGQGAAVVTATYTDAAGNVAANSPQTLNLTIDTLAPAAFTASVPEGPIINAVAASDSVLVRVQLPAGAVAGDIVTVSIDGSAPFTYTVTAADVVAVAASVVIPTADFIAAGEGPAVVTVTYADAAGNPATGGAQTVNLTIDTIAPSVVVLPQGDGNKTAAEATDPGGVITVTGEAGSTSTVTLVGPNGTVTKIITNTGAAVPVTLTAADLTTLGNGNIEVSTVTRDVAGNVTVTPDGNDGDFVLDTIAPNPPDLSAASDTGISNTDNNTSDNTPSFNVPPLAPGSVYNLFVDGQPVATTFDPATNTITIVTPLSDAPHQITATVTDLAGNQSNPSAVLTLVTDTTAPGNFTPTVPEGAGDGVINAAEAADGVPVVIALPTGAVAGDVITVSIDGSTPITYRVTPADITAGNASVTLSPSDISNAGQGPATVQVTYADAAGNVAGNSPQNIPLTINTTAAGVYQVSVPEGAGDGLISGTEATSGGGVPVSFALPTNAAVGDVITASIDGSTPVSFTLTAAEVTAGSASILLPTSAITAAGQGAAVVTTTYTTGAGNPASNSGLTVNLVIDTVAPNTPAAPDLTATTDSGSSPTDNITNVTQPAFAVVTTPAAGETPTLYVDGNPVAATYDAATNTLTPTVALTEGPHSITTALTDPAGNLSAQSPALAITIDVTAPLVTVIEQGDRFKTAAEATDAGGVITVNSPAGSTSVVTFVGSNGTVTKTITDTGAAVPVVLTAGDLATLGNGAVEVTTITTDAAGNRTVTADTNDGDFTLDTIAPSVVVLPQGDGNKTAAEATDPGGVITVTGEAGSTSTVTLVGPNGTVTKIITNTGAAVPVTLTAADLTTLGNGNIEVSTVTRDVAGNVTVTPDGNDGDFVLDTIAPNPPDLSAASDTGISNTDNNTSDNTPSFNVPPLAPGSVYNLFVDGQPVATTFDPATNTITIVTPLSDAPHQITATVTDLAGNQSNPSAVLTLVTDTTAPGNFTPTVPEGAGDGVINAAEAADGVPVVIALPTGAVAGDVITVSIDGSTPITYRVTPADITAGNASVTLSPSDISNAGQGPATVQVTYAMPLATSPATARRTSPSPSTPPPLACIRSACPKAQAMA